MVEAGQESAFVLLLILLSLVPLLLPLLQFFFNLGSIDNRVCSTCWQQCLPRQLKLTSACLLPVALLGDFSTVTWLFLVAHILKATKQVPSDKQSLQEQ